MKRLISGAAALGFLASLSACGLTGDLKRPGPLIGTPRGDIEPASLPDAQNRNLPELPERPSDAPEAATEDELLGGPES